MSDARCPACAAAVRPDDPWCTLCFADLRQRERQAMVSAGVVHDQVQVSATEPQHEPPPASGGVDLAPTAPVIDPADPLGSRPPLPRWTCPSCAATPTFDDLVCPTCGHAPLRDREAALPSLIRADGKNARVTIMLGGAAALTVVLVALFWLVGSLL